MSLDYRIRRCESASDAEEIHGLVGELGAFEKKQEALTQTVADYKRDGFETSPPLFCAALAEYKKENVWVPVGLAVWYFTYSTWKGKSFYLEDRTFMPSSLPPRKDSCAKLT